VSFCRECGKEVQAEWVSCPYCSAQTGISSSNNFEFETQDYRPNPATVEATKNNALWNVSVIAIAFGILFWPHGIFDITLVDRATANCSSLESDIAGLEDLEDDCQSWKKEGFAQIVMVITTALLLLLFINSSPSKGSDSRRVQEELDRKPPPNIEVVRKQKEERGKRGQKKLKKNQAREPLSKQQIFLIIVIISIFIIFHWMPLFTTFSSDGERSENEVSMSYLADCEINSETTDQPPDIFCTEKIKGQVGTIRAFFLIATLASIVFILSRTKKSEDESGDNLEIRPSEE
jgi:hypothetical protein